MNEVKILDCSLRDGGYITNWDFGNDVIMGISNKLSDANIDYIELGYLNNTGIKFDNLPCSTEYRIGRTIFDSIEEMRPYIQKRNSNTQFLAMADVNQFTPEAVTQHADSDIDGIRVVFYKHDVHKITELCKKIHQSGYRLFIQPMVTIDYSIEEYSRLIESIVDLNPSCVSIVDSFGYMSKNDYQKYFSILNTALPKETAIGFHSHANMQLSFVAAQEVFLYKKQTDRELIIDASLYGMGRGAGNLNTELIANYYNSLSDNENKYNIDTIVDAISDYIMPLKEKHQWGYTPYTYLTALYRCHPNYASYLLENHSLTATEFREYLLAMPSEMHSKCTRAYVEELYNKYINEK